MYRVLKNVLSKFSLSWAQFLADSAIQKAWRESTSSPLLRSVRSLISLEEFKIPLNHTRSQLIPQKPCTFDSWKSDTCHWIQNTIRWQLPKKNYLCREDNSRPPGHLLPQGGGCGRVLPYNGLYGETPPERVRDFTCWRIERVEKSMISVCKRPERSNRFILFLWKSRENVLALWLIHMYSIKSIKKDPVKNGIKDKRWGKTFLSISPGVATLLRSNRQP